MAAASVGCKRRTSDWLPLHPAIECDFDGFTEMTRCPGSKFAMYGDFITGYKQQFRPTTDRWSLPCDEEYFGRCKQKHDIVPAGNNKIERTLCEEMQTGADAFEGHQQMSLHCTINKNSKTPRQKSHASSRRQEAHHEANTTEDAKADEATD